MAGIAIFQSQCGGSSLKNMAAEQVCSVFVTSTVIWRLHTYSQGPFSNAPTVKGWMKFYYL